MALAMLRILTRLSLHIDGEDFVYYSDTVHELDDVVLNLIARGLAELV